MLAGSDTTVCAQFESGLCICFIFIFCTTYHDVLPGTVCVFSSHLFWTSSSLDVPVGVTQEEGHTGFLIHLPSAVRALTFLARRIQPFLSLVDREAEFCVLTIESFSTCWAFYFHFYFLVRKIPFTGIRTHVPTCHKVARLLLSYRGCPSGLSAVNAIGMQ